MITGSETPSLSTRLRMMLTESSIIDDVSCLALERLGLQHDLEAALEVEALVKRAVPRGSGNGEEGDAGEGGDHEEDQRQMRAA